MNFNITAYFDNHRAFLVPIGMAWVLGDACF